MLKIIDIILKNSKSHFFANFEKHHQFFILYDKIKTNFFLNKNKIFLFKFIKIKLKNHIVKIANIIITTIFNTKNSTLYTTFKFSFIIINEITKTIESNMWNLLKNYIKISMLMIENEAQFQPVIFNTTKTNGLVKSLKMSLFF